MRRGSSEGIEPQTERRCYGVRDEKEEQEERQKASCEQEPNFCKGKTNREEPIEKGFNQA
jgi:hypothetical protein